MSKSDLPQLLLVPGGEIGSHDMVRGGLFLIGLGTLLDVGKNMLGLPSSLAEILGLLSMTLIVPWVFLWTKRFRAGGYPSAMALIPMLLFPVFLFILVILFSFDLIGEAYVISQKTPGDVEATNAAVTEFMESQESRILALALVMKIIAGLILLFGTNKIIEASPR